MGGKREEGGEIRVREGEGKRVILEECKKGERG